MNLGFAQSPQRSETNYFVSYSSGGTVYYPQTIEKGLAASTVNYAKNGSVINCESFSDLNSLYTTINAQTSPAPFIMGQKWIMEDLHKPLYFQINGETQQILRLVKRKTGAVTALEQSSVSSDYSVFYVPTFVNFNAESTQCIFDVVNVARVG
jgi:hypothetical protein